MELTDEQIVIWRKVLVSMGMMKIVVDQLPREEIQKIAENMQKRIDIHKKSKFVSKFRYKRF